MPKITSVEPQKATGRFNIYIDGQFAFGADEDLVVEHRLIPGKMLDTQDIEKLLFEAEVGKLMEKMYRLWSIRARSEKEVRDYFAVKNYQAKVRNKGQVSGLAIDLLIKKLKQKNMLNDFEFAKAWVESRRKSQKKGKIALKHELLQKGIDREIVDGVIAHQSSVISEGQIAQAALGRKLKLWQNYPKMEFRKKAYQYLARKGFEYSIIREIVEKVMKKEYNGSDGS